jgi:hypothetical protein
MTRLKDRQRGGLWKVGPYTIIKKAWERQYAIFKGGSCIHTTRTKAEALRFAASQS